MKAMTVALMALVLSSSAFASSDTKCAAANKGDRTYAPKIGSNERHLALAGIQPKKQKPSTSSNGSTRE